MAVPTSERTRLHAASLGIALTTLDALAGGIDVTIDGADSIDPNKQLVKVRNKQLKVYNKQLVKV